jgi:hypothetical protein
MACYGLALASVMVPLGSCLPLQYYHFQENDMMRSYQPGVNAYVVKPVDFHEFINSVIELGMFWAVINEPPPGAA